VTTAPQHVTVQVSNSTGKTGLAAVATSDLEHHGFNVMTPDDSPSSLKSTTVFYSPGNEPAAATFANSKVARVTGIGRVVQVVLGPDFRAVSAPPPSGSSVNVQIDYTTSSSPTTLPRTFPSPTPPTPVASDDDPGIRTHHTPLGGIHHQFIRRLRPFRCRPRNIAACGPPTMSNSPS
jgi:hypothetical protein